MPFRKTRSDCTVGTFEKKSTDFLLEQFETKVVVILVAAKELELFEMKL